MKFGVFSLEPREFLVTEYNRGVYKEIRIAVQFNDWLNTHSNYFYQNIKVL